MSEIQGAEWPELPDGEQGLPGFPTNVFSTDLQLLVRSVASTIQVSEGMVSAFVLGVASAAIVGRVVIQPKSAEPWYTEPGQLYVLCQGKSGERKTPVLRVLKAPLEAWLEEERKRVRRENRHLVNRIEATRAASKREHDPEKAAALADDADRLAAELKPEPEYLMADMTMEAVGKAMEEHSGRAAIVHDEADFLMTLAGKTPYTKDGAAVNLGVILNGFTNEAFHGQRVGRGEWHIPRASAAICLAAQPRLLHRFVMDADGADRGLQSRFLYFLPPSMIGMRVDRGGTLPSSVTDWWEKTIVRLASIARDGESMRMQFDPFAEAAYGAFFSRIERRLALDLGGAMESWGGKLVGNTVRLAGILALLDGAEVVGRGHWDAAETIAESYLIPCAIRLFRGPDPALPSSARKVLSVIRDLDSFNQADLYREKLRYVMTKSEYNEVFPTKPLDGPLMANGYIRWAEKQPQYVGTGRKPSPVWEVHPALHRKKAPDGQRIEI